MRSIQTKFVLLILSCILLCSLIIGGGAIVSLKQVIDENSARYMNLQSRESAEKFNSLLARIEQSVKTLSVFTLEELTSVEQLKTDASYLEKYTQSLETIAVNAANNTIGALAVYVRLNPDLTHPEAGIFWSKTSSNGYFQKHTPTNFANYSSNDIERVGWYYIPIQNGKAMWMDPYYNKNINARMISYVVPLYRDNQVLGVVGMDIDFRVFEKLASDISIYDTGYAFLCDSFGKIMYHPEYPLNTEIVSIENSLQALVSELKNKTSSSSLFSYKRAGQNKKIAYRSLDNGMILAIAASKNEIDAVKDRLIRQSFIAIIAISLFFIFITIVITGRIIKPLRELNIAAQKIANGDLNITLTQASKDEVGMLADSFQTTVKQLQKHINYINGLAFRDALTGVKNKMAYQEIERHFEAQMRIGQPRFAIVVMDINNLKLINDKNGHDFGDILIMDTCRFICKIFKYSPIYRIGGDEFVAVLENSDYDNYAQLMEDFNKNMEEYNQKTHPDNYISVASGIAVYNRESDLVFANVFKRADDAMYKNKAAMKAKAAKS